jgi:hypothetical protein
MAKREPRSSTKYKNIVGSAFPNFVKEQISARKKLVGKKTRNIDETLWLTNRVGWTRLSSGAKTKPDGLDIPDNIRQDILSNVHSRGKSFLETNSFPSEAARVGSAGLQASQAARKLAEAEDALYTTDLAKANVLQGGTVSISETKDIDGKVKFQANRKTQFNELYKQGATDQLGLKPMPGITSISVGTGGKWQTLLQGDVEFICYDLDQLEIMSKLYMSLGVHVFLEWGHSPYIDKDGNLLKSNEPIDYFNINSTQDLLQKVTKKKEQTGGNYGALVGRVYNFDFVANNDGSYTCKIQIMGPGGMLESLRINKSSRIDYNLVSSENNGHKYSSDLHNALYSIRDFLSRTSLKVVNEKNIPVAPVGGIPIVVKTGDNNFGIVDESKFFTEKVKYNEGKQEISYGELLNKIYKSCTFQGPQFDPTNPKSIKFNGDFMKYGNAWQIVSNFSSISPSENNNDNLDPIPLSLFFGFSTRFSLGSNLYENVVFPTGEDGFSAEYITFGHLLCLIQHVSVFTYTNDKEAVNNLSSKTRETLRQLEFKTQRSSGFLGTNFNPVIYIDYHPDNTKVLTGPIEASLNPGICMVPLSVNTNKDVSGDSAIRAFGRFFNPLNTMRSTPYSWESNKKVANVDKNLTWNLRSNKVNESIKTSTFPSKYDGKLNNVLINLSFAISELEKLSQRDQEVNLIEYLNAILDGINISLGKVNNFRAFFDDCSNVVRIIDENLTEEVTENLLEIPNYGLESVTYNYSYSSKVSPKLASQIVIASQASDIGKIKDFPEDVLTYNKLNGNVRDRFAQIFVPPIEISKDNDANKEVEQLKATQKLFDDINTIYTLDELINGSGAYMNLYADLQNINRKYYSTKNTNLVIPLVFSIEMDGIDGILPYNAFKIPDDRLPKRYRGKVAFAVFNINHNFNNNNWTTTLNGQTILINPTYIPDTRQNSPEELSPKPVNRPVVEELATETYGGALNLPYTKPNLNQPSSPAEKLPTDTTSEDITNTTTPDGRRSVTITSTTRDDTPAIIPTDIQTAIPFIKTQESRTGAQTKAYKDVDFTVAAGYKWRIGWGSDTITTPGGSTRAVKEGI